MGVNGIYGLSGSGIDVESMVKVGMMGRQSEYNKLQQQFTKDQWQKQAYNEIYGSIQTFNNSTLTQYKLQANMNAKAASTTSSAVSVTANGSAPILNHKIQVHDLSSSAYMISTNSLKRYDSEENNTNGISTSINLADVLFQGLQENVSTGSKMANVTETNGESSGLHKLSDTAFELQISDGTNQSTLKYTYKQLLDGTTFNDLVSDINSLGTNVRASYDSVNDTFNFYNKEGGSANGVFFNIPTKTTTDDDGNEVTAYTEAGERAKNFLQSMHLFQSRDGVLYGQNGEEVEDVSSSKSYFGYESTVAAASLVTSQKLTDADGYESDEYTSIRDLLFKDTNIIDTIEVPDGEGITYDYYDKIQYTTADGNTSEAMSSDTALSFSVNGQNFSYSFDELLQRGGAEVQIHDLLTDIEEKTGLTAEVSEDGYLSFSTSDTGVSQSISITADNDLTANLFNRLGFVDGTDSTNGNLTFSSGNEVTVTGTGDSGNSGFPVGASGTNGKVTIDGVTYDNITDNKITAAGVTYSLLEKTNSAVTVNVTQDTQGIIDKVKSFVEDYNKLLSSLYEKYDEKQYKDYKPLTESQKEQMKDEQIEKWEEKAKSGILYHDQTLNKLIYAMRDAVSTPVEGISGKYDSVFSLGISTTGLKGQLTLDEDKLRNALNEDPDSVYNVFGKLDKNDNYSGNGVAQRLGDVFTDGMKSIRTRAGTDDSANDDSDLGVLMRNLQTRMSDFKKLMDSFEDKLYKKYDAMEVALSQLGVQLNYITWGQ